jgi:hypothetical protein
MPKVKDAGAPEQSTIDVASAMVHARFLPLIEWIASAGLSGQPELRLLEGFCERARGAGLRLGRAVIGIDTLHPVLEGRCSSGAATAPRRSSPNTAGSIPNAATTSGCRARSTGSTRAARRRCAAASMTRGRSFPCCGTCGATA